MPVLKITPQNNSVHKKRNYVKITGYAATAAAAGSLVAAKSKNIKLHKYLGYAAGFFTLAHIGLIEWYKHKKT